MDFYGKMIWAFMSNNIVTIKADRELLNQIIAYYQKYQTANDGQYILFQAKAIFPSIEMP